MTVFDRASGAVPAMPNRAGAASRNLAVPLAALTLGSAQWATCGIQKVHQAAIGVAE
jgi:hypothetical protein